MVVASVKDGKVDAYLWNLLNADNDQWVANTSKDS